MRGPSGFRQLLIDAGFKTTLELAGHDPFTLARQCMCTEDEAGLILVALHAVMALRKPLVAVPARMPLRCDLDRPLGGGLPLGRLVLVYGAAGTGKSQLALQAALHTLERDARVAFITTIKSVRLDQLVEIGQRRSANRHLSLPRGFADWESAVRERCHSHPGCYEMDGLERVVATLASHSDATLAQKPGLVVVDSITTPIRACLLPLKARAERVSRLVNALRALAARTGACVIVIDEIVTDAMGGHARACRREVDFASTLDYSLTLYKSGGARCAAASLADEGAPYFSSPTTFSISDAGFG